MRKVLILVVGMSIVMNLSAYEVWTDVQTGIEWKYQLIGDEVAVGGGDGQCENTAVPKSQNGVLSVPIEINGKRVTAIGPYAFCDCKGLTSILIPDTVTRFGHHAFSGCSGLEAVTIPEGVMRIDCAAFIGCSGLLSLTIPSSVTDIEDGAFDGCCNVSSYDVDKDNQDYKSENGILLTKDGRRLVAGVKGVNLVPDGVTVIGGSAYYGMTTLTSITFPDSIAEIGWAAFYSCTGLKSVVLPEGVVRIEDFAFAGCSSMAYVSLPSSLVFIGDQAFSGCSAMQSFCVETTNPSFKSVDGLLLTKDGTVLLAGVNGSVMVPDGVKSIGTCAFDGCSGLESVAIPIGVTSIGDNAFRDCSGLQSIAIPDGMKSIGRAALSGCTGLTTLSLPSSVTNIGVAAFDWCCNLTSMVIPGSVSCVEGWAFDYCQGLESVTIAEGVGSIGMCAFQCCENLISIIVPSSVTTIGYGAFNACAMLCDMTFEGAPPEGLLEALINQDALIRYNVAFKNEWLPVIAECGFTNAVPYSPLPKGAVVFIAPNGEVSVETHVYTNDTYGVLPEARRDGFTFAGWYTSLAGNERVSAFSAVDPAVKALYARWVESDTSLYAQWDANRYSVSFNANGGQGEMTPQPFLYDQIQNLNNIGFSKTGYTFKGWSTNSGGEVVYKDCESVSNLTAEAGFAVALFAKWEKVVDVSADEIEEWVGYTLAPKFKKEGESNTQYRKRFEIRFGEDYHAAFFKNTGKIGQDGSMLQVWHDYVAGTDPLDEKSKFTATICFDDEGRPIVDFIPKFEDVAETDKRLYRKWGKLSLKDDVWIELLEGKEVDYKFFKVTVEMK